MLFINQKKTIYAPMSRQTHLHCVFLFKILNNPTQNIYYCFNNMQRDFKKHFCDNLWSNDNAIKEMKYSHFTSVNMSAMHSRIV